MAPETIDNFIAGEPSAPLSGNYEQIFDPATGEAIALAPLSDGRDVDLAVIAARAAFHGWSRQTPALRAHALLRLADLIEAHGDELAELEAIDAGKPISAMREDEIPVCSDNIRFFAGAARCLEGRAAGEYMEDCTSFVRREPVGVIAQITPWNYPLMMAIWKVAPALAAGNTVVLKPAETTPLTTIRLAQLAADVLPAGVLNVVVGHGDPVGTALTSHPGIDMISLTGSVTTGKAIARGASESLKRVHLELGGNAPVILFGDADIDAAVATIKIAGFYNAGQDCTAATRVLVADQRYDDFVTRLTDAVSKIKLGPTMAAETELGPLNSVRQRTKVEKLLESVPNSAQIVTGGPRGSQHGCYLEPTIIVDLAADDQIVQEEIFGPVVTVQRFKDETEALALANGTPYGLAASVWTRDVALAMHSSAVLDFGCVWVNDHLPFISEMPHGGFKQSGYGKDLSVYGLEDYTRIKHVMVKLK